MDRAPRASSLALQERMLALVGELDNSRLCLTDVEKNMLKDLVVMGDVEKVELADKTLKLLRGWLAQEEQARFIGTHKGDVLRSLGEDLRELRRQRELRASERRGELLGEAPRVSICRLVASHLWMHPVQPQ